MLFNKKNTISSRIFEFKEIGVLIPLVLFSLVVGIFNPVFFTFDILLNTIREASFIGIIALGMTFVLIANGIDISVGSVLGLSGAVAAKLMVELGLPVLPSSLLGILTGTLCGLIIGTTIVFFKIPPLIASLGMMYAARGVTLVVTKGHPITGLPKNFLYIGQGKILGLPFPIFIFLLLAIISHIILNYTKFGVWIKALGGNKDSARLSGLPIKKLELSAYLISGTLAGLSGMLVLARVSASYSQTGRTWEMLVIASVIIGGTSLFGGVGTIIGSIIGVIIIRTLNTSLVLLGINVNWQEIVIGCIIVVAVAFDSYQRRMQQKRLSQKAISTGEKKEEVSSNDWMNSIKKNQLIINTKNTMKRDNILELNNITKYYGFIRALDDVSLSLRQNEILGLVGDNGAGKSTLIKIISGALDQDIGKIKVFNEGVEGNSPKIAQQKGISTVYQHLALIDCLDIISNLYLGREPSNGFIVNKKEMKKNAKILLDGLRIDLPSHVSLVGNLSGGQRQVVAIAKALSLGGKIIILDEPTAAIGVEQQGKVLELILELKTQGCSIIVISHNLNHVFTVCDRICVLRGGKNAGIFEKSKTTSDEIISYITGSNLIGKPQ